MWERRELWRLRTSGLAFARLIDDVSGFRGRGWFALRFSDQFSSVKAHRIRDGVSRMSSNLPTTELGRSRSAVTLSVAMSRIEGVVVFAALLGFVVALQTVAGAYASEFGGYADEPAHLVTSLMARDFIA